ncbi:hypothetical protein QTP70_008930 [Hemibagrus guttatus]|uniref:C-type lectin domain-containing protein n=1 Tax=Hemibagrus guttatus TaxID=175788 RepID=A0AAE0UTY3_9TELE|nr:hypothetical protein QTP70_008930 [Hemibagrus guttatus]
MCRMANRCGDHLEIVKSTKFLGAEEGSSSTCYPDHLLQRTFYTFKSILSTCITSWFGNCTVSDRNTLQQIVRTAEKIIRVSLPSITDIYSTRCIRIVDDPTHPSHTLFTLLPSEKRMTWHSAQVYCRQHHTDLAMSRDATEDSVIKGLFNGWTLVGLFRDSWKWTDQTNFSTISWESGKPDNAQGNENCGYITNSQAVDALCSDIMPFFCFSEITGQQQIVRVKVQSNEDVNETAVKAAILEQLKKFLLPVKMLFNFYTAIMESILTSSITVWFAAATAGEKAKLQRVIHSAEKSPSISLHCKLQHSELDEVMESIPTGERVVIGADFNGHVGEGNRGDEVVMGKFGVKERNLEGQMVVDFAKRMDMAVVNTYFQKWEEHRVTYKSGGRRTQVDYILCRRGNLKEINDCKVVVGENVARQHRMVVCRMTLMDCRMKSSKIEIEKKTKWWKLKKEECCEEFRQKLRQALGGQVVLPDDWKTTAEVIRESGRKVLDLSSGRRKEDKETWWWNEEVQDSVQRKRLAKKKWDMDMRIDRNTRSYSAEEGRGGCQGQAEGI